MNLWAKSPYFLAIQYVSCDFLGNEYLLEGLHMGYSSRLPPQNFGSKMFKTLASSDPATPIGPRCSIVGYEHVNYTFASGMAAFHHVVALWIRNLILKVTKMK